MNKDFNEYGKYYSNDAANKLLKSLRKATRDKPGIVAQPVGQIVKALGSLLSALENPDTPLSDKVLIVASIGYIILPVDLIPDTIPIAGYSDDLLAVSGIVAKIEQYSTFSLAELDAEIDRECNEQAA